jgi:hypothetical protein
MVVLGKSMTSIYLSLDIDISFLNDVVLNIFREENLMIGKTAS